MSDYAAAQTIGRISPAQDKRHFLVRLAASLRPDIDLKGGRFWIKGKADF